MNDPLHEENLHLKNDFLSNKSLALPHANLALLLSGFLEMIRP